MAHQCLRCGRSLPEIREGRHGTDFCPVCRTSSGALNTKSAPDPDILIADVDLAAILRDETVEAACPSCGFSKNIPVKYEGLRVRCLKCALVYRVLRRQEALEGARQSLFRCGSCGMERAVPPGFLGKRVRCPRCRNISLVSEPALAPRTASALLAEKELSTGSSSSNERRARERVFVQNVDLVMGILGDFRCRDLSASGVGFFPGRGDWDFHRGSTINFDLSFRKKPLIRNMSGRIARTNASMVGCTFMGLSNLQEQLLGKLMKSQRFQMASEDGHPHMGAPATPMSRD